MAEPVRKLTPANDDIGDDLIVGAKAIAEFMRWPGQERRIYNLAEKGAMPIWNEVGLGVVASKSALKRYVDTQIRKAVDRAQSGA